MKFKPLAVPAKGHPAIRRMFAEMNAQKMALDEMEYRSGVCVDTFKSWRTRHSPKLDNLEACLNALGLEITVTEKRDGG